MKLWVVKREEFSGYDCNGHWQTYIVAARDEKAATELFPKPQEWDQSPEVTELVLPNLNRLKVPRIVV
jgi:hypothetical protein